MSGRSKGTRPVKVLPALALSGESGDNLRYIGILASAVREYLSRTLGGDSLSAAKNPADSSGQQGKKPHSC